MTPLLIENHPRRGILSVEWDDGSRQQFAHAQLRACCPCAECRALRRSGASLVPAAAVRVLAVIPAGANAVNLSFDDGHARGIYPFPLLARLDSTPDARPAT